MLAHPKHYAHYLQNLRVHHNREDLPFVVPKIPLISLFDYNHCIANIQTQSMWFVLLIEVIFSCKKDKKEISIKITQLVIVLRLERVREERLQQTNSEKADFLSQSDRNEPAI